MAVYRLKIGPAEVYGARSQKNEERRASAAAMLLIPFQRIPRGVLSRARTGCLNVTGEVKML
jgi:hypothetical protein